MSMPIDPNAQAEADADEANAKTEAERAAHDQLVADDEEKLAADEAQLAADEGGSAPEPTPAPDQPPSPEPTPEPTPAPLPPTPDPQPNPDEPQPTPEPAPEPEAVLYEFVGADPSLINRGLFVDSGLTDDSGNALYFYSGDPSRIDSTEWAEYGGPTQPKNTGTPGEQAARGVTNHGLMP